MTRVTPTRPVPIYQTAKNTYIGRSYQLWYGVLGWIWWCCLTCVTKWEVCNMFSIPSLLLLWSNLDLWVLQCCLWVYITPAPKIVSRDKPRSILRKNVRFRTEGRGRGGRCRGRGRSSHGDRDNAPSESKRGRGGGRQHGKLGCKITTYTLLKRKLKCTEMKLFVYGYCADGNLPTWKTKKYIGTWLLLNTWRGQPT